MTARRESSNTSRPGSAGHRSLPWLAFGAYILVMTAFLIALGVAIEPDRYFFVLFAPVLLIRRGRRFLLDWLPFLLLLFSYEFLRGLAGRIGQVHYLTALRADSLVFHTPPTVTLQAHFFNPSALAPWDYLAAVLYLLHFVMPLSFAFLLWLRSPEQFSRFTGAFLLLSYAALITFVLFPAAPPWLASRQGYLPQVKELVSVVLGAFPQRFHLPTVYQLFDPNTVAAIPSLHAAYPFLIFLFACRFFGLRGLLVLPYVVGVWLAVIYMGEHYAFDVAMGALYGTAAFAFTELAMPGLSRAARLRRRLATA